MKLMRRDEIRRILAAAEKQGSVFQAPERRADVFHLRGFCMSAAAARTAFTMFW
jgi:hypothetical protein